MADDYQIVNSNNNNSNSDDSDNEYATSSVPELRGYLSKWTNYIHGWQPRFIVLKDGTLSYYKSEQESDFGCRGAISLQKATIKSHEFDECRFDVSVNNCVWYLRAETPEDKNNWIDVLQSYKTETPNSEVTLRRYGSSVSLQSNTLSTASGSSLKRENRSLKEKLNEIETFKDILFGQIETLQRYFDACADLNQKDAVNNKPLDLGNGLKPIDFKGESITFRATTAGVLTTLQHCLDIMSQRDEAWRRKLDREIEKRRKTDELYRHSQEELLKVRHLSIPGPDLEVSMNFQLDEQKFLLGLLEIHTNLQVRSEKFFHCECCVILPMEINFCVNLFLKEGPHSKLPEDEFFDAVESGLDKIEIDRQLRKLRIQQSQISSTGSLFSNSDSKEETERQTSEDFGTGKLAVNHRLWPEIDRVCLEQLHYARQGVGEGASGWQLFADEGEMKMYRREIERDGMVMDPLKSCHVVKGVTAREMCNYFYSPEYRNDWEITLEEFKIVDHISPDCLIFLQTHKRIWPANQRDALFWSHMRKVEDIPEKNVHDEWIVCNHSTEIPDYPANQGKCLRIYLTVILQCQTVVTPNKLDSELTRDDLTCKIAYCSVVNPGGWAPATVLRAVYKKEYPKFLKRFTQYVIEQCQNKPIMF